MAKNGEMAKNDEMAKLEKWEKTAKTYENWDKLIIYLKKYCFFYTIM